MTIEKNEAAAWISALKTVLFYGPHRGMRSVKAAILSACLTMPIIVVCLYFDHVGQLDGAIPPDVPVVRAHGKLFHRIEADRFDKRRYQEFVADSGEKYQIQHDTELAVLDHHWAPDEEPELYVQGFYLRNPKLIHGQSFWLLSVQNSNGKSLLTSEQSLQLLQEGRDQDKSYAREALIYSEMQLPHRYKSTTYRRRLGEATNKSDGMDVSRRQRGEVETRWRSLAATASLCQSGGSSRPLKLEAPS